MDIRIHEKMKLGATYRQSGSTMPEIMVAALLLAVFFASIFELNAVMPAIHRCEQGIGGSFTTDTGSERGASQSRVH